MGKPWENHGKMVIYMERSTICLMGESTISTGPLLPYSYVGYVVLKLQFWVPQIPGECQCFPCFCVLSPTKIDGFTI